MEKNFEITQRSIIFNFSNSYVKNETEVLSSDAFKCVFKRYLNHVRETENSNLLELIDKIENPLDTLIVVFKLLLSFEIEDISKYEYINSSKCSEFEYLPIKALKNFQYLQNRKNEILVLSGNTEISEQNKNGTKMTAVISNTLEDSVVELPYIYYKGYTCKINGKKMDIIESENGMVSVKIPKGIEGSLNIKYTGTKCLYVSLAISILTCFVFVFYIAYTKLNNKKNDNIK